MIEINSQMIGFTKKWRTTLAVNIVHVDVAQPPWTSESLSASQVASGANSGADLRTDSPDVEEQDCERLRAYRNAGLIARNGETAHPDIGALNADNPLPLLAELRYYQFKKLAEPSDLDPVYDRLLGPGGAKMLEGNAAERRQAVEALFQGDSK